MEQTESFTLQNGKYKIIRKIGSGGFGVTYEAEHTLLDKRLAIKEFLVTDCRNCDADKLKRKFIEEAVAISKLKHPNIVDVTDVFEENGTAYYVMSYIDGQSLQSIIDTKGALLEGTALEYTRQVAAALQYVHSHNRLHLDVKPGNIMIDGDGRAVLIDFGASKQYDESSGENKSTLIGMTPGYAPLEQMGGDMRHFHPATDVYSLGATLYFMLSGRAPLAATVLASDNKLLQSLPSHISTATRTAVTRAMQLRLKDRPQSMDEFIRLLPDNVAAPATATTELFEKKKVKRLHLRWALPLAAVALAAVVLLAVNLSNRTQLSAPSEQPGTLMVTDMEYHNSDGILTGYYTGVLVDSVMDGEGEFRFVDGSVARGTFRSNQIVSGTIHYADSCRFEGTFKDEHPDSGLWYEPTAPEGCEIRNGQN